MKTNIISEIERRNSKGHCISLIYDDNGNYAFVEDGMQNVREDNQNLDITHFVHSKMFRPTIQEAWDVFEFESSNND